VCHAVGQHGPAQQHREHALEIYTDLGIPEADAIRALIAGLLPLVNDKP
jgi:hypothetical protein